MKKEIELSCEFCNKIFTRLQSEYNKSIKRKQRVFCSLKCKHSMKSKEGHVNVNCAYCNKKVYKLRNQLKESKSGNHFCNSSCSALYNNKRRKTGTKVSKLEKWIQQQLNNLYSDLKFLYNDRTTINSELDIYIPSLSLAFELNGIYNSVPFLFK